MKYYPHLQTLTFMITSEFIIRSIIRCECKSVTENLRLSQLTDSIFIPVSRTFPRDLRCITPVSFSISPIHQLFYYSTDLLLKRFSLSCFKVMFLVRAGNIKDCHTMHINVQFYFIFKQFCKLEPALTSQVDFCLSPGPLQTTDVVLSFSVCTFVPYIIAKKVQLLHTKRHLLT